ncbi:MAG: HEPN domain-containing protein [Ignavibacteriales bacterium]|nr:HEPN domain-containing protein [Ignavibacteriales bacterium]
MKEIKKAKEWLGRAKSNLSVAKLGKADECIFYEDLCFEAQQSVEKALKAPCIYNQISFPKTHDISFLISLLEKNKIEVSDRIKNAKRLTDYAVETRYPADLEPVTENEYKTVIKIAEEVFELIDQIIK